MHRSKLVRVWWQVQYLEAPGAHTLPIGLSLQQLAAHAEHVCIFSDTGHLQEQHSCPPLPLVCVSPGRHKLQQQQRLAVSFSDGLCKKAPCSRQITTLHSHSTQSAEYAPAQSKREHIGTDLALLVCNLKPKLLKLVRVLVLYSLQASLCS